MKVLLITKTLAESANIDGKLRAMSSLDIDLTVVSPPRWRGSTSEIQKVKPDTYRLLVKDCWFSGTTSLRVGNHLHLYPAISDIIDAEKWDLVHMDEEPFNLATYDVLRRCQRFHTKTVFTTWQNLMKNYPPPFGFFEKYTFEHSAGAIAGNAEGLEILRRRGFIKLAAHIPQLGVDPSMFSKRNASDLRRKLDIDRAFAVGFVGRLSPEKGINTLIKAMSLLPAECFLVLLGDGPERGILKKMVDKMGLSPRVRWVPWVRSAEVAEYINAFDILVLPSRTRWNVKEQFGRVLIEAMACQTCVVGSDSGEIPRVIGDAGLVFHEGDERELAMHLRHLLDDSPLRERLGRQGRQRVQQHYTYEKVAKDTVAFYNNVCSS